MSIITCSIKLQIFNLLRRTKNNQEADIFILRIFNIAVTDSPEREQENGSKSGMSFCSKFSENKLKTNREPESLSAGEYL